MSLHKKNKEINSVLFDLFPLSFSTSQQPTKRRRMQTPLQASLMTRETTTVLFLINPSKSI